MLKRCTDCNVILANVDNNDCDICHFAKLPLNEWLKTVSKAFDLSTDKARVRREYVEGLWKRELGYHFDDCAEDCLSECIARNECTLEDAKLINEITSKLYCEELFIIALKLEGIE